MDWLRRLFAVDRNLLETLVRQVADAASAAIESRLAPGFWEMPPSEARGYARARVRRPLEECLASIALEQHRLGPQVRDEVLRLATDQSVDRLMHRLYAGSHAQTELRRVA